jgi:hypothetical protein
MTPAIPRYKHSCQANWGRHGCRWFKYFNHRWNLSFVSVAKFFLLLHFQFREHGGVGGGFPGLVEGNGINALDHFHLVGAVE